MSNLFNSIFYATATASPFNSWPYWSALLLGLALPDLHKYQTLYTREFVSLTYSCLMTLLFTCQW